MKIYLAIGNTPEEGDDILPWESTVWDAEVFAFLDGFMRNCRQQRGALTRRQPPQSRRLGGPQYRGVSVSQLPTWARKSSAAKKERHAP